MTHKFYTIIIGATLCISFVLVNRYYITSPYICIFFVLNILLRSLVSKTHPISPMNNINLWILLYMGALFAELITFINNIISSINQSYVFLKVFLLSFLNHAPILIGSLPPLLLFATTSNCVL